MHRTWIAIAVLLAVPVTAAAGKGTAPASCTVSGSRVTAVGLPTSQVINFMLTDGSGTSGWVLGFTHDGTWTVTVPQAAGPTTYRFVSRTRGPDGSKYTVFASCS